MANERSAANAAEKSPGKPSGRRSGHRSGRSGSRSGQSGSAPARKPGRWTWREYMLQLSVVILGIVITFAGSGLIERWQRQRQVKMTMQLIVEELHTNRALAGYVCEKLEYDRRGMLMFQSYDMDIDAIPVDSLHQYGLLIGAHRSFVLQADALEVLKASGAISSVGDKQFLMKLLGCYNKLKMFGQNVDSYNVRKIDALNHLFTNSSDVNLNTNDPRGMWKSVMSDPLCLAFIGTSAYYFGGSDYFTETLRNVDEVLAAINEKYRFE